MEHYIAAVCTLIALGTLVFAGLAHALSPRRLIEALEVQSFLPRWMIRPTAKLVILAEVFIGLLGLAGASSLLSSPGLSSLGTALAGGLYTGYSAYSLQLVRKRDGAPCGCSADDHAANRWTVGRNVALAAASFVGFALTKDRMLLGGASFHIIVSIVSAVGIGLVLWNLPATMSFAGERR